MATPAGLRLLFHDARYVAADKPAGLLVHPTPECKGETDTLLSRLQHQLSSAESLRPVHRLDRGTSGVVILARSAAAAASLSAAWQQPGWVQKDYLALVVGSTAAEFESAEPLTKRKVQTAAEARNKKRRKRATAAAAEHGTSGDRFCLSRIADQAMRRYIAELVSCIQSHGGAATMEQLSTHCRAEDFGLQKGTGLRATIAAWPRLWAVRKEPAKTDGNAGGSAAMVRRVRLLRTIAVDEHVQPIEAVSTATSTERRPPTVESASATGDKSGQEAPSVGVDGDGGSKIDERQPSRTLFHKLVDVMLPDGLGPATLLLASPLTGRYVRCCARFAGVRATRHNTCSFVRPISSERREWVHADGTRSGGISPSSSIRS